MKCFILNAKMKIFVNFYALNKKKINVCLSKKNFYSNFESSPSMDSS